MSEQLRGADDAGDRSRAEEVADTLLRLTDTLSDDFDVVDLLALLADGGVRLVGGSAAAVLLDDQNGNLAVIASTNEDARLLAITELQHEQGPGVQCLRSGQPVAVDDFGTSRANWPQYVMSARAAGFRAGLAVPLRLRDELIGALEILHDTARSTAQPLQQLAAALAEAATIGILHRRTTHRSVVLAEQLQHALNSRVVIEQAKGMIAERRHVSVDAAFEALRHYARSHNIKLNDVAAQVVAGKLEPPPAPTRSARPPRSS